MTSPKSVTVNLQQRLFVIPSDAGYSCLGFDVCFKRTQNIARELARPDLMPREADRESLVAYQLYLKACDEAKKQFDKTGKQLICELDPMLIGYEGKRVRVVDSHGETRSFVVGRSMGFIPTHLELHSVVSKGGPALMGSPLKYVTLAGKNKRHS